MNEKLLRTLIREALLSERSGSGKLDGLERTLVQDLYLGKLSGRELTGNMGEEYAELLFPGAATENTNPGGVGAGKDSSFADIKVFEPDGDRYYSVKASAPTGEAANASTILSNAKIKTQPIATAIEKGEIPVTDTPDGKVARLGVVLFGLESNEVGPTRARSFTYRSDVPIEQDAEGKVIMIDGIPPSEKRLGANALRKMFPEEDVRDIKLTPEETKKYGDKIRGEFKDETTLSDTFRQLRLTGNKIQKAMGEDTFDEENIEYWKGERSRLENLRGSLDKVLRAIEQGKEFEIVVKESDLRGAVSALLTEDLTGSDKADIKRMIKKELEGPANRREIDKAFKKNFDKELRKALGTSFFGTPGKINKFVVDEINKEVTKSLGSTANKDVIIRVCKEVIKKLYRELSFTSPQIIDRINPKV